jgi:hypothetical protein
MTLSAKIHIPDFYCLRLAALVLVFIGITYSADSQSDGPYKTRVGLSATQFSDNSAILSAKLRVRIGKSYTSLIEQEVVFYNILEEEEKEIGKGTSDKEGMVDIMIEDVSTLKKGEDGYITISAVYDGGEEYKADDDEITFKRAVLEVNAVEEDSIQMLYIKAFDKDSLNPLTEQIVTVQVPRLFNNLIIAEEETNDEGIVEIEFPDDIQIHEGNEIDINISLLETDDYATVSSNVKKEWAKNHIVNAHKVERGLWSPDAPIWMVLTFAILMILVWGHYGIICYKLYLIKKEGNTFDA